MSQSISPFQSRAAPPPDMVAVWMPRPTEIVNCPTGLEYLTTLDRIEVNQVASLLESFVGWDTNNKYVIKNSSGEQCYYAMEDTDSCMRFCCSSQRGFKIFIVDNMNQVVMKITREFKCCGGNCWCAGCCDSCAHEVVVEAPEGQIIGYVKQKGSGWRAHYDILDELHNPVLHIIGPCCIWDGACCPCDNDFKIFNLERTIEVGQITKKYAGFVKEAFTLADNFSISFPMDLSVKAKATMLGALFLISSDDDE